MAEPVVDLRARRFARLDRSSGADVASRRMRESIAAKQALVDSDVNERAAELAEVIVGAIRLGGKVLLFGNGGSAADATHLAAEFVGRFRFDRAPMPALSLTDNASSMSAIGNDYDYDLTFARQVEAFGRRGDVAIGISTSGTSPNVLAGLETARTLGLRTAALTGSPGGELPAAAELCLCMPCDDTARIQECYLLIGHVVCELVERALFEAP
jgi:D-sedoheptulose 7-phosphate isomerase